MITIKINKGYTPNFTDKLINKMITTKIPEEVGFLPEMIPFIKPKLLVKKGDFINTGFPLISDKRNPDIKFLSPGGGVVKKIKFGERRVIKEIVIKLSENEDLFEFKKINDELLKDLGKKDVVGALIKGGLWPLFRELPFRDYPHPDVTPPSIIIHLNSIGINGPESFVYLKEKKLFFLHGLKILKKLCERIFISINQNSSIMPGFEEKITHYISGEYPCIDPGVLLYHIKKSPAENKSWFISGQDVILMGELFKNGSYPVDRMITITGAFELGNCYYKTRAGFPVKDLINDKINPDKYKIIQGGYFRGFETSKDSYLGFLEKSISVLKIEENEEMFGFLRPGFNKPSFSRTFLSYINTSEIIPDCNLHGEKRACINCGTCVKVCLVDIFPQFTYKAIYAEELDDALLCGLLDCVECGLCSYVCPSKIELLQIFKKAKIDYYKEQI